MKSYNLAITRQPKVRIATAAIPAILLKVSLWCNVRLDLLMSCIVLAYHDAVCKEKEL